MTQTATASQKLPEKARSLSRKRPANCPGSGERKRPAKLGTSIAGPPVKKDPRTVPLLQPKSPPVETCSAEPPSEVTAQRQKQPSQQIGKGKKRASIDNLRIFTLNVWGLRADGKKEDLHAFLVEYSVHIGVITETHLLKPDAMKIAFSGYTVVDADGRYTNKGGVMIIVADEVSTGPVLDDVLTRSGEISMC